VEEHKLEGIVSMPSGVFKPYAGVSTAVLLFTKTGAGGTDQVWFYDMQADGFSLDDKRLPLDGPKHESNNIPDILFRWKSREAETYRSRLDQSFLVSRTEIAENHYDLSIGHYREVEHVAAGYDSPQKILDELDELEGEIQMGLSELRKLLA
jgi:type I restriction enzyme M protein